MEWVSRFPHEDLFIIVVIKVATNYVKSFNFLDRSNHLEAIIQKYEWRVTCNLASGLLRLHRAIKCSTWEPKGLGLGVWAQQDLSSELITAAGMVEPAGWDGGPKSPQISSLPSVSVLWGATHPQGFKWRDLDEFRCVRQNGSVDGCAWDFIFAIIIVVRIIHS